MRAKVCRFAYTYISFVFYFCLQKVLFLGWYHALVKDLQTRDFWDVVWHGLPLDLSVAGYLTIVPALLLIAGIWIRSSWIKRIAKAYFFLISILLSVIFILNLGLYEYWGFPLDVTPFFYFESSPADALASVPWWVNVGGIVAILAYSVGTYWLFCRVFLHKLVPVNNASKHRIAATALMTVLAAVLFLPIRGGVTVSTMNVGYAYYSKDQCLNHAAVNPVLSLMESISKEGDFAHQYRFMEGAEAARIFSDMMSHEDSPADTLIVNNRRPNVVFIILESFSTHLMSQFGNTQHVTPCLDSIAARGLLFTNFYANSFRTDRGLVSILSGYPAQPTTSIMKYARKTQQLRSIAAVLHDNGYHTQYYYGGDADFTNMRSYLVSSKFEGIVSDHDFPMSSRLSKWGVPDHLVFERVLDDLRRSAPGAPMFTVVQTSSSHEPFDVPYSRFANKRLNAFAYTDSVVGHFVNELQTLPIWDSTLVVLVPDHQGCWPTNLCNTSPERFRIPLILTGGALIPMRATCDTFGSQTDIAATLLAQLGISHRDFAFSKDLLSSRAEGFAFFTIPDAFGLATAGCTVVYDNQSGRLVYRSGDDEAFLLKRGQAFLQILYDDLASR